MPSRCFIPSEKPPIRRSAALASPTSSSTWSTRAAGIRLLRASATDPLVGVFRPRIIRSVVDLPAPFGPRKPVTLPDSTVKVNPSTAVVSP